MRSGLALAMLVGLAVTSGSIPTRLHAQAVLPAGEDLTIPPDMRTPAAQRPVLGVRPGQTRATTRSRIATPQVAGTGRSEAASRAKGTVEQAPDFGVTMRGGSGTPRVYAPLAGSEAVQESGSAFGAAMKFGF